MDAGAIVEQKVSPLKDGATRYDLETSLANVGAKLFTSLLINGITQRVTGELQDDSAASYYPNPSIGDYEISLGWSARHAYNFIRGTCSPSNSYKIQTKGNPINIISTVK
jgi:methionyl-tRNA formyltransferase